MNPSDPTPQLRLRSVRDLFRLIGEVRELGDDPRVWRPHMVRRLCGVFQAQIVISSEVHAQARPGSATLRLIDIGWGCDADQNLWDIHAERDDEDPQSWRIAAGQAPHGASSGEAVEVPVKPLKPVYGGRSFILSQYCLPHINAVDQLGLHRAYGSAPFTAVEHKLVRLFHVELGRLWRRDALQRATDPTRDLPPRLSQTLAELLNGLSEKEIAARLDLSRHTIHNYVKALHQRFEVSSRGELMAKVGAVRKPDFVPKLAINPPVAEPDPREQK